MQKSELAKAVDDCLVDWEATIAELGAEGLERPGACGEWRVRDVLGHIHGWDRWNIVQLEGAFSGAEPTASDITGGIEYGPDMDKAVTADERNAVFYATCRDRPLDAILADFRDVSAKQSDFVRGAKQDQLDARIGLVPSESSMQWLRVLNGESSASARAAADWLTEQLDHRREHLTEIREWMRRRT